MRVGHAKTDAKATAVIAMWGRYAPASRPRSRNRRRCPQGAPSRPLLAENIQISAALPAGTINSVFCFAGIAGICGNYFSCYIIFSTAKSTRRVVGIPADTRDTRSRGQLPFILFVVAAVPVNNFDASDHASLVPSQPAP